MPDINGWQLAAMLRARFAYERLRLVAVTAYDDEKDRINSRKAGFDAHVVKPVSLPLIESILQTILPKR